MRRLLTPILQVALDTHVVVGDPARVTIGERVALANAILNLSSGRITLGDRTILSYGVMLITGRHEFIDGIRASVHPERDDDGSWGGGPVEVPDRGFDIVLGRGVWVGAGAIVLGGGRNRRSLHRCSWWRRNHELPSAFSGRGYPRKAHRG